MGREKGILENMEMIDIFNSFYKNKIILVTGHTGFKGSWLSIWLNEMGAKVIGYALEPYTKEDNFVVSKLDKKIKHIIGDIRNYKNLKSVIEKNKPEIIFHLAAQSLVYTSYNLVRETYDVNVMGTVNVLEAARISKSVKSVIIVTSDKCYENNEQVRGYCERDPLGGKDPYSSSKGCAELVTSAFRNSFFNPEDKSNTSIASVRAGNVIGGGDWAEKRIIPDCIKALKKAQPIKVRNPESVRPWQYVLEPLRGYLLLCSRLNSDPLKYSGAWNFGPMNETIINVKELVEKIIYFWGKGNWKRVTGQKTFSEAKMLVLDYKKALENLKWNPVLDIDQSLKMTVDWYKDYKRDNVYDLCVSQIKKYINILDEKK